jgi:glycosyltransferase involved in cell wall biosynthesis
MKIFQIVDSKNFGGIETHILQLCLFLKENKYDIQVIFITKHKKNALRETLKENNIEYTEGNFKEQIKKNPQSVFHSHGYKANIFNKMYKLRYRHNAICSYHSGEKHKGKVFFYEMLDKKSAFVSNKNIAISNLIEKQLLTFNKEIVYNFINKDPEYSPETSFKNLSFVGRLSAEKNPSDFIDISKDYTDLNFNIFGSGELNRLIPNRKNLFFYGYVSNQETIWKHTDVLLITSKYEGLPYVLIEAMSRGLIIVSYKVGEIPNIIEDGKNGFLVNNIDEMKSVINKIKMLNKKDSEDIKKASLKTFESLFGKASGNQFLNIYN